MFVSASFVLVLLGGGLAYELWTNAERWRGRASSFSLGPLALVAIALGTITLSLTATIFLEGLKAGLLTFGGAYTVIPFLQESAVNGHAWLTDSQFVDGLAIGGVLPAPLIIFSTFVGYIAGGLVGALAMTLGIFLPAFVFPIYFHRLWIADRREPPHPPLPARRRRRRDRADRGRHASTSSTPASSTSRPRCSQPAPSSRSTAGIRN